MNGQWIFAKDRRRSKVKDLDEGQRASARTKACSAVSRGILFHSTGKVDADELQLMAYQKAGDQRAEFMRGEEDFYGSLREARSLRWYIILVIPTTPR